MPVRKKSYRPLPLLLMLKEVERELRKHKRAKALFLVRHAAAALAEDIDMGDTLHETEGPALLM